MNGQSAIPSPQVVALSERVLGQAAAMMDWPGYTGEDWTLQRLVRTLLMWSISIERMAASGPAALTVTTRGFSDHPEHARAGEDPLATLRAHLDVISFLTMGDMVLQDVAALLLERRAKSLPDPPGAWASLMHVLDAEAEPSPMRAAARNLDLLLVNARHRVAAHWRQGHTLNFGWEPDGTLRVNLVDPRGLKAAARILREIDQALRFPSGQTDFIPLREWIFQWAIDLDYPQRNRVRRALELAGYGTYPVGMIVAMVLMLVSLAAPGGLG